MSILVQHGKNAFNIGDFLAAGNYAEQAIKQSPNDPQAQFLMGMVLLKSGQWDRATEYLDLAAFSGQSEMVYEAALHALKQNLLKKAEQLVGFCRPEQRQANLWAVMASLHLKQARKDQAVECWRLSLSKDPDLLESLVNLANVLAGRDDPADLPEARQLLEKAYKQEPGHPAVMVNLANVLKRQGDTQQAEKLYERALEINPNQAEAWMNLAAIRQEEGDPHLAEQAFVKSLQLKPGDDRAIRGLGHVLLAQGKFREGWPAYARRFYVDARFGTISRRPFSQKLWQGEDISNAHLLVWAEQGLGEELMYGSLLSELSARCRKLTVELDPRLVALFQRSMSQISFVARTDPAHADAKAADLQIACGEAPQYLRNDWRNFPKHKGYLQPDPKLVDEAKDFLSQLPVGPKIGIAWFSGNKRIGDKKSCELKDLADFFGQTGAHAINLQYGDIAEEIATSPFPIHQWPSFDPTQDQERQAALISCLDLTLSISNATAHLAGAIGAKAWVMLHTCPFWHWFRDRSDSPWYPSLRLFRQQQPGDWAGVIDQMKQTWQRSND